MNHLDDVVSNVRKVPRKDKHSQRSIMNELAAGQEEENYLAMQAELDYQEMLENQRLLEEFEEEEERLRYQEERNMDWMFEDPFYDYDLSYDPLYD